MRTGLSVAVVGRMALVYLAIPTLIFLGGFLTPWLGLPMAATVAWVCCRCLKRWKTFDRELPALDESDGSAVFPWRTVLAVFAFALAWSVISGQGHFVAQKWDWNFRNACFRDLITHSWPVRYSGFGNALVFYVGHWLPAAGVSKLAYWCGGQNLAWPFGNAVLMLWTAFGVTLAMLLYLAHTGTRMRFGAVAAVLLFVLFGGLDAVVLAKGFLYNLRTGTPGIIENWAGTLAMENKSSQLSWVFHQAVPAWVATMLVLDRRSLGLAGLILSLAVISAPLPTVGLGFLIFALLAFSSFSEGPGRFNRLADEVFSGPNLFGAFLVLPLVGLFLGSNPKSVVFGIYGLKWLFGFVPIVFVLSEFGLYLLLLRLTRAVRGVWLYAIFAVLMFATVVYLGSRADFPMRVSIPALLVLQLLCAKTLLTPALWTDRPIRMTALTLVVILGFGGAVVDIATTVRKTTAGRNVDDVDQIVSFDRDLDPTHMDCPASQWDWRWHLDNFYTPDPDGSLFFRYLSR